MTARRTRFTEPEFRAALVSEIRDLIQGRTTYQRSLEWLYEVQIGLMRLPMTRIASISQGIKLLLFSLRADESGRAAPCETKPSSHNSHSSHHSHLSRKGASHAENPQP
jgi:hypothetical protein